MLLLASSIHFPMLSVLLPSNPFLYFNIEAVFLSPIGYENIQINYLVSYIYSTFLLTYDHFVYSYGTINTLLLCDHLKCFGFSTIEMYCSGQRKYCKLPTSKSSQNLLESLFPTNQYQVWIIIPSIRFNSFCT